MRFARSFQNCWCFSCSCDQIQMRVIDATVGQAFDLLVEDLNNDGRVDLLLTAFNNTKDAMTGNVLVYEIPDDLL